MRLAATVADERLGDRDMAAASTTGATSTPSRATPRRRACSRRPSSAGRPGTSCATCWRSTPSRISSPSDRIPYLRRSAALSAESIGDRARAASTLRSLLDIDPTDARAASDLESLLRADERWSDLREHLLWMLEQVSEMGGDLNGIAFRLAELEEQKLDELSAAVERYGEILGRMPRHAGALGALERLLADRDQRGRVAEILEPHFRKTQEWRKLADVLEVSLESIDDSEKRSAILVEIAGIEEKLGRLDKALDARGRAWLEDVTSPRNLAALEPLAAERPAVPAVRRHPARRHRQGRRPQPAGRAVGDDRLAAGEPPGRCRLGHRRLALGHRRAARRRARPSWPWSGCWPRPAGRPSWPRRWSSTWTSSATPTAARP